MATRGVPAVPGYRTGRLLGFGSSGEVWSAVSEEGAELVALKVVPDDGGTDPRALREGLVLRRVRHPHVVRLRDVVPVPGVGTVLVLDRALGGSLAALVAARGRLDVPEVVTVLTPLAGALADLHEGGLVHGDVSAANVLFDESGRPLLGDLASASVVGEGRRDETQGTAGYVAPEVEAGDVPGPASDVFALAAVGWHALTGLPPAPAADRMPLVTVAPHVPVELALLLEEALDADPSRRPGPRDLAARCFSAAQAEPVRLVPTDPAAAPAEVVTHRLRRAATSSVEEPPAPSRGRHRRQRGEEGARSTARRVALALLVAAAAVSLAWWVVPVLSGHGSPSDTALATQPIASGGVASESAQAEVPDAVVAALRGDDPVAAVPALAWLRARGLATGDPALLELANAPGGPALATDLARLESLYSVGATLDGLSFDVRRVDLVRRDGRLAVVDAAVTTSAHRQVGPDGAVHVVAAGDERLSRLVLRHGTSGWQVLRLA